ncbi:glycosyltransferase [Planobispora siamensis]|uniref:Glycosyl transferase n=1 Tax=Planobispora siamensis TaxID=936338 RepID=A0A8J3SDS7_9ACTN|nr:glycosyltransferase [Planobispora siamensis]GIH90024.1 glycosyl transferase [Planobispora siamensis]
MAGEQLESTRQALREAVAHAERAAELARLLDAAQARLAEAERAAEELGGVRERLGEVEERLAAAQEVEAKLRKDLAEQRYQTEVARWKLSSVQVARWSRLGDAIKTGKSNPVRLARGLRGAAKPAKRPSAPRRQPVPQTKPEARSVQGAAFQATTSTRTVGGVSVKLKPFRVPTGPNTRPHLTAAVVAEPHAEALLRYEWRQTTGFTPKDFARVLAAEVPHLLLVESVTEGPWAAELKERGEGLRALLAWCAERGIRTVFWHTRGQVGDFAAVASLFEHIVTALPSSVAAWGAALAQGEPGPGRREPSLGLLPFAIQPRVHNPLPLGGDRFDRVLTLDELLPAHLSYPDVLTSYRWPKAVDCPPGTEPWRMAELAACGTPIGTEPDERRAHVALRQAYASGTMTQKADELLEAIGLPSARATLNISVIMIDRGDLDHTLAQVAPQKGVVQLVLLSDAEDAEKRARAAMPDHVDVMVRGTDPELSTGAVLNRALDLCEGDLVAVMDGQDAYGEHYLTDLSRAFLFATADIVGKAAYFAHLRDVAATVLRQPDAEYSYLPEVAGATLLARRTVLRSIGFADVSEGWDEVLMRQCRTDGIKVFSADRYGYVRLRDRDRWLLGSALLVDYGPAEPHAFV